jgi:hypothetical protein
MKVITKINQEIATFSDIFDIFFILCTCSLCEQEKAFRFLAKILERRCGQQSFSCFLDKKKLNFSSMKYDRW